MKTLSKKIDYKLLLVIIGLIIYECIIFIIPQAFVQNPFVLSSSLDSNIPFVPHFVWIYVFWYFMLVAVPYYIAKKNISSFYKYTSTFIITTLISGIIFVIFPNTVIRADITSTDLTSNVVKIIYLVDSRALNCLPSIHCLYSFLFIFAILDTKESSPIWMKIIVSILSILVVLSTLFIKQHIIYDALAAFVIGIIVWIIIDKSKLYKFLEKLYNKLNKEKITTQD